MADQEIGGLRVQLSVDAQEAVKKMAAATAKMEANAKALESGFGRFSAKVEGTFQPLLKLQSIMGGLAGAGFVLMIKGALDTAGALKDMEDRTGASTDRIQTLQQILAQMGVGTEATNSAIEKFTKNVGDARNGAGELVTALKDDNRAFLELLRTAPSMDAALQIAFDQLAAIPDAAQRAALAADLFGKQGVKLAAVVKDGAVNFSDLTEEMKRAGSILDKETIAKADEAGDRLMALGKTLDTLKNNFILAFIPELLKLAKGWQALIDLKNGTLFPQIDELTEKQAKLYDVNKALTTLRATLADLKANSSGPLGFLNDAKASGVEGQIKALQKEGAELEENIGWGLAGVKVSQEAAAAKGQESSARAANVKELKGEKYELAGYAEIVAAVDAQLAEDERLRQEGVRVTDDNRTATERLFDEVKKLDELLATGNITLETRNRALEKGTVEAANATDGQKELEASLQKSNELGRQVALTFGDAFADAIVDGKNFGDVLKALEKDLLRMALRAAMVNAIGGLFGGAPTGGGEIIGGINVGPRAEGGPIRSGQAYLVGEQGPELIVAPMGGGNVIPNHQLNEQMGGGTTVYLDARGADASAVARMEVALRQLNASVEQRAWASTVDYRRRGGRG